MEYLIGLLALGGIGFFLIKNRNAQALLSTLDIQKKVNDIQGDVIKNQSLGEAEEKNREDILKKLEDNESKKPSEQELQDFLNLPH